MAGRAINKLSARFVATVSEPGRYGDGGNLHLAVSPSGARSWLFLYRYGGRQREMGLGPARDVPLAKARALSADARALLAEGVDPIEHRRKVAEEAEKAARRVPTFGEAADALIEAMEPAWRNPKHRAQWRMTLGRVRNKRGELTGEGYCLALADQPVNEITTADVLAVLKPLWQAKPETASRIRGRIEAVLSAAKAQGHRTGENPALWRGHLDHLLPARAKLSRGHHAALPYTDAPAFMTRLRASEGLGARALEFAILTAARSGEVRGATWTEIDLDAKLWTVPAVRMKGGREHRVPLSDPAMAVIEAVKPRRRVDDLVFPGTKLYAPLSDMSLSAVLRRMKAPGITVHGFRSAFRDWAGDATAFPRDVAEAALAHAIRDSTEAAYRRGDALQKRRELMAAWASYLDQSKIITDM